MFVKVFFFVITSVLISYLTQKNKENRLCSAPDWLRRVYKRELESTAIAIATVQTLAPNNVKITIWRRLYLRYFLYVYIVRGSGGRSPRFIYIQSLVSLTSITNNNLAVASSVCRSP